MPRKRTKYSCTTCDKSFYRYPSDVEGRVNLFCSRKCYWEWSIRDRHWNWKGGKSVDSEGYVWITVDRNVTVKEHRWVWEQANGVIPDGFEIHHRDGDKSNNALENLELLSKPEHLSLHKKGKQYSKVEGWARHHDCCVECGTTSRPHGAHGLCKTCYLRYWRS